MTGIVLMHGWGLGPATWNGWLAALADRPVAVLDAGYAGPRSLRLPDNADGWIGIGHSQGFARLAAMAEPWRALVGVSAFLHFCPVQDSTEGTPPEVLDAMLARLETDPSDVLARFLRRCGIKDAGMPSPATDLERLRADLADLRGQDLRTPPPCPTLLLHAADDRIAPVSLGREAAARIPGARLAELPSGGHALPLTRPGDCLALVQEYLRGLS